MLPVLEKAVSCAVVQQFLLGSQVMLPVLEKAVSYDVVQQFLSRCQLLLPVFGQYLLRNVETSLQHYP
jgi:hypothetical protein